MFDGSHAADVILHPEVTLDVWVQNHVSHSQRTPFFRLLDVLPLLLPAAHDCANCVLSFWQSS